MEGIPLRTMIPSTSTGHSHTHGFPTKTRSTPTIHLRRTRPLRFAIRVKLSDADFQELPASELISSNKGGTNSLCKGTKGPIASVALALGFHLFAARYSSGDLQIMLTPRDLIVGMMGFLACKVSVVLVAFKPFRPGLKLPT